MKAIKYIIRFVPFFLLFYAEGVKVGGFSLSQAWKIPLILYLLFYVFTHRPVKMPTFIKLYYGLTLKNLFNSGMLNLVSNIQEGLRYIFIPLIYGTCTKSRKDVLSLSRLMLLFAQYFILTNIPFLFFGLPSLSEGMEYGDFMAYTGIFQNQHAMSTMMSICILVLLNGFRTHSFVSKGERLYNALLLCLAIYSMFLGFARTGWLMCILGIVILYYPSRITRKQIMNFSLILCVLVGAFVYLMSHNEMFHDRVLGIDVVSGKQLDVGSGRGDYIRHAIDYYKQGNTFELIFGRSMNGLKEYEYQKTGMAIYAHNGFITMLAVNGAIGVLLMVFCLISLYKWIRHRKNNPTYKLALSMWMMNLSFQLTQGGHFFHADLFYAMIFAVLEKEYREPTIKTIC